eukprot:2366878-Pyramimonas_sp.AAC.2
MDPDPECGRVVCGSPHAERLGTPGVPAASRQKGRRVTNGMTCGALTHSETHSTSSYCLLAPSPSLSLTHSARIRSRVRDTFSRPDHRSRPQTFGGIFELSSGRVALQGRNARVVTCPALLPVT